MPSDDSNLDDAAACGKVLDAAAREFQRQFFGRDLQFIARDPNGPPKVCGRTVGPLLLAAARAALRNWPALSDTLWFRANTQDNLYFPASRVANAMTSISSAQARWNVGERQGARRSLIQAAAWAIAAADAIDAEERESDKRAGRWLTRRGLVDNLDADRG